MQPVDIVEVASAVSHAVTIRNPSYAKVSRIVNDRVLELVASVTPVTTDNFFPPGTPLTTDLVKTFFEYTRAFGCDHFVVFFAATLRFLCDNGVPLTYESDPIDDIYILNTTEFEVVDLLPNALQLCDAKTSITVPAIATHEGMHFLSTLPRETLENFGMGYILAEDLTVSNIQRNRPKAYKEATPHWWVSAVVDSFTPAGIPDRKMVHLDICGSAYNRDAFHIHEGKIAPLEVFCTPELIIATHPNMQHKFLLHGSVGQPGSNYSQKIVLPRKIRHFRCLQDTGASAVELTPLETFLERNVGTQQGVDRRKVEGLVHEVWNGVARRVEPGTLLVLRGLEEKSELNGQKGRVHSTFSNESAGHRVAVKLEQLNDPIFVSLSSITFEHDHQQYRSHQEIKKFITPEDNTDTAPVSLTAKDRKVISRALNSDPAITKAFNIMTCGKMFISSYADPEFRRGIKKLLEPPFNKAFPTRLRGQMELGLVIADHPKADIAFKLMKMLREAKTRAIEEDPTRLLGTGAFRMEKGTQFHRLLEYVVNKIKADRGLTELFAQMDVAGLYASPVRQLA